MVSDGSYIWFGIPGRRMQWVPAPKAGFQRSWTANQQILPLLDGRQLVQTTRQRYSSFQGDFFGDARDLVDIDVFNRYASGYYGSGPICFADPYAALKNVFAPHWATPALFERGWAPLTGFDLIAPPSTGGVVGDTPFGRPDRYTHYDVKTGPLQATSPANQFNHYIAIPPNATLRLGVTADATGTAGVYVQTYDTDDKPSSLIKLDPIDYNSFTQMTDVFHGDDYSAVRVFISRGDESDSTLTLYSMMGQLYPLGQNFESNGYITTGDGSDGSGLHQSGQGHNGLVISGEAIVETYNYNGIKKGLSLTLEETV